MIDSMILKTIGQNIRDLRKNAHLRQIDLAVMVDIDCSYLSSIENGKRNPSILLLQNIATALGVSVRDLLSENMTGTKSRL